MLSLIAFIILFVKVYKHKHTLHIKITSFVYTNIMILVLGVVRIPWWVLLLKSNVQSSVTKAVLNILNSISYFVNYACQSTYTKVYSGSIVKKYKLKQIKQFLVKAIGIVDIVMLLMCIVASAMSPISKIDTPQVVYGWITAIAQVLNLLIYVAFGIYLLTH